MQIVVVGGGAGEGGGGGGQQRERERVRERGLKSHTIYLKRERERYSSISHFIAAT